MADSAPKTTKKTRASTLRSRYGCLNCKARRIKCGEERPSCKRCTVSGWDCDYAERPPSTRRGIEPIDGQYGFLSVIDLNDKTAFEESSKETALSPIPSKKHTCASCKNDDLIPDKSRTVCLDCIRRGGQRGERYAIHLTDDAPSSSTTPPPKLPLTAPGMPDSTHERRLLHYFTTQAVPDMSGYYSITFWQNVALPACHQEPVIQSAILALSAAHMSCGIIDTDSVDQYSKALRQLQAYMPNGSRPSVFTVLTCSAIFYCIELSRGNYDAALRHQKAALQITQEWKNEQRRTNSNTSTTSNVQYFTEVFSRLDLQVRIFEDGQPPHLHCTTSEERSGVADCTPSSFENLGEARAGLDKLTNWLFNILETQKGQYSNLEEEEADITSQSRVLQEQLARWCTAYTTFVEKKEIFVEGRDLEKDCASMLGATYHCVTAICQKLTENMQQSLEGIEGIERHFERMLSLSENMVEDRRNRATKQTRGQMFDLGLVPCLWLLVQYCDDESLCKRGIDLMKEWHRRDGSEDEQKSIELRSRLPNKGLHTLFLKNPWLVE